MNRKFHAVIYALSAAVYYAAGLPFSKLLLDKIEPVFMAGFMYIGAGLGVGIIYMFHFRDEDSTRHLGRQDMIYVVGMVVLDIIAPILLMAGVNLGTSSNASLLGNFEIVFTALFSLLAFGEPVSRRLWTAIALITLSGIILSFDGAEGLKFSRGALLVLGAALCWGLENNCTRSIAGKSTYQIVTVKGLCSGAGALITALIAGEEVPDAKYILPALVLGFIAYGLSIFTYIRAQNVLGAARTGAYYAAAPFIGSLLSFVVLGEDLSLRYIAALLLMIPGAFLAVIDALKHRHFHEHCHVIYRRHGGMLHADVIRHSHMHNHYISEESHRHIHSWP
ncbi:MAG: DMT family transporter [Synergistaceae bacterium]|nr:DMT family transporter [Synergistaceae bacterium]